MSSYTIGFEATPLLGHRSGVGQYTNHLLTALTDLKEEWDFWLFSNRPFNALATPLQRTTIPEPLFPYSRWLWLQLVLPRQLARSPVDVVHFPNSLAPLRLQKPFVLSIHDASLFLYSRFHPWSRLLAMRFILPVVARRAAAIVTVSHSARADLQQVLSLPEEKLHVIYEAAPDFFQPVKDERQLAAVRTKYHLPEQFLLYVGTLEPRKNLYRVIRAFRQLRQRGHPHHLVMVGPRGWSMVRFEVEVAQLGLSEVVHQLGYVPQEDLPTLYSLATLFLFPSLYEGFGLPPLEAMACGTAVLTSDRSSLAEICTDAAYLVNPLDEQAITAGIHHLLTDPDLRRHKVELGLARAAQFSWRKAAQETAALYQEVITNSK